MATPPLGRHRFLTAVALAIAAVGTAVAGQPAAGAEDLGVVVAVSSDVEASALLPNTEAQATSALALSMTPDATWLAGDNAYAATAADYTTYPTHWGRLGPALDVVPGNHDAAGMTAYAGWFGTQGTPLPRAKDVGAWRVYFLDSNLPLGLGSATYAFLQADLAAHSGRPIAAIWHTPRWSSDANHGDDVRSAAVWDLLYAAHADLVVNGHAHGYQRFAQLTAGGAPDAAGIREFVVATAARPGYTFTTTDPRVEYRQNTDLGVLRLVLRATSYEWQFVNLVGAVMDSGSAVTHQPDGGPPTAPTALTATAEDAARVALTWSPATDDVAVTGYRIYRDGALLTGIGQATTHTDPTVTPTGTYCYQVTAVDGAGNESPPSEPATVTTPADTVAPTAPAGVSAQPTTSTTVALAWSPGTDNVAVTGYTVYRDGAPVATTTGTSYADTGLTPGTSYGYAVDAYDAAGNRSPPTPSAVVTTPAGPVITVTRESSVGTSGGRSVVLPVPVAAGVGDLLVASVVVNATPTVTPPAGWTHIGGARIQSTMRLETYRHVLAAGDPATYTWKLSKSQPAAAAMVALAHVAPASPVVTSKTQRNSKSTSATAPSVSGMPGAMLLVVFGIDVPTTLTPPLDLVAGPTARSTSTVGETVLIASRLVAVGGPTGREVARAGVAAASIGQTILLSPAA